MKIIGKWSVDCFTTNLLCGQIVNLSPVQPRPEQQSIAMNNDFRITDELLRSSTQPRQK